MNRFDFISDDRNYTLVIKEQSFLFAGKGTFYKKNDDKSLTKIDTYTTDDGYDPFSSNGYSIKWDGSIVTVEYDYNSGKLIHGISMDLETGKTIDNFSYHYDEVYPFEQ